MRVGATLRAQNSDGADKKDEILWMGPEVCSCESFLRRGYEREYSQNSIIYREEDPGDYVFYLQSGLVKITMTASDGTEKILALHRPGTLFGESAALDGGRYFATAVAMIDSVVRAVPVEDLTQFLFEDPDMGMYLMNSLVRKMRLLAHQVNFLSFLSVPRRLARLICGLAETFGVECADGVVIDIRLKHRDLADLAGASRVTVTNTLIDFRRRGFIGIEDGKITVKDPDELLSL